MSSDGAVIAAGFAGGANSPAVEDHQVAEKGPVFLGYQLHQGVFQFNGVFLIGQAHQARQADDVGVGNNPGDAKGVTQDDVGGLAPHSGQR